MTDRQFMLFGTTIERVRMVLLVGGWNTTYNVRRSKEATWNSAERKLDANRLKKHNLAGPNLIPHSVYVAYSEQLKWLKCFNALYKFKRYKDRKQNVTVPANCPPLAPHRYILFAYCYHVFTFHFSYSTCLAYYASIITSILNLYSHHGCESPPTH